MNELSFRGKDRYHPSWPEFAAQGLGLAVTGVFISFRYGVVGFYWLLCGMAVLAGLIGLGIFLALRSWTTVGPAGITICWGIGRGRVHPWQEIRWIDVRETKSRYSTSLAVRMTLANGRCRSLPALQHSTRYPDAGFQADFRRVVDWWKSSTDPAARSQPPKRLRNRLTPPAVGFILGLLVTAMIMLVVVLEG